MPLFREPKYSFISLRKKDIPQGLWTKCNDCGQPIYNKNLDENLRVCPKCNHHFSLNARQRIDLLADKDSFEEFDPDMTSCDPLEFKGTKTYKEKLEQEEDVTGLKEAVITGKCLIDKKAVAIAVTDSRFIMGSMGSVVGEKITRAIEFATENKIPVIIISGSGGGARMYEGMFSLMQMAKTSCALMQHKKNGFFFLSVLTDPTMAGVMASFAGLGDIIIAEPKALIGFTGPRVIEQTIRQKLPEGFQRSEFLLEHGLIDMIVHRKNLKSSIGLILDYAS